MRKVMWFAIGMALAAVCGIYFLGGYDLKAVAAVFAMLCAIAAIFCILSRKVRPVAMVFFGCTVTVIWLFLFQSFYLQPIKNLENQQMPLTIELTDYSWQTSYGIGVEGTTEIEGKTYRIVAYANDPTLTLKPGDHLIGAFRLRNTTGDSNGETTYHMGNGIFLLAYPKGTIQVRYATETPWYSYPAVMAQEIKQRMAQIFPGDTLGFAQALLLGDSSLIDYETDTAFKISGIRHIIAVSGLHVTILFSLVYALTGRRRFLSALLGLPVLIIFAALAGFTPSINRACIMHGLMVISLLFDREYDPPTALAFAVAAMLGVNPYVITSVSFQLSVGCMVGIFLFSEPIRAWLMDRRRLGRWQGRGAKLLNAAAASVSMSLSASLVTTPLCAWYFGTVSLVSVLTNLLTLWAVTFIFYGIMASCLIATVFVPAGAVCAWLVSWPMRYVIVMAKSLAAFPLAAVYTDSIYIVLWLVLCYCLLAVHLCMRQKQPLILSCCCVITLCIAMLAAWTEPQKDDVRMTVLDVGQGQCILLQSEGKSFLIDCGGDSDAASADTAAQTLLSLGIYRLDGAILTHYDRDHAGGMANLLYRVPADYLYLPNCLDEAGYSESLQVYSGGDVQIVDQHMSISFGAAQIQLITTDFGQTSNESGLCILFQRENCDILITGDRNAYGERDLLRQIDLPDLEVLIVGHHGSKFSTCQELLETGKPDIAIISVGQNSYGHPAEEVLSRLQQLDCDIYRTDRDGTVIYRG